jgi:hypothetical protein
MAGWIDKIKVSDGLEEETGRIVSYIKGDTMVQLQGFFSFYEISDLADYLRSEGLLPTNEPPRHGHPLE